MIDILIQAVGILIGSSSEALPRDKTPPPEPPAITYKSEPELAARYCREGGIGPLNCEGVINGRAASFSAWAKEQKR